MGMFSYICTECGPHEQFDWSNQCIIKIDNQYYRGRYDGYGGVEVAVDKTMGGSSIVRRNKNKKNEKNHDAVDTTSMTGGGIPDKITVYHIQFAGTAGDDEYAATEIYCDGSCVRPTVPARCASRVDSWVGDGGGGGFDLDVSSEEVEAFAFFMETEEDGKGKENNGVGEVKPATTTVDISFLKNVSHDSKKALTPSTCDGVVMMDDINNDRDDHAYYGSSNYRHCAPKYIKILDSIKQNTIKEGNLPTLKKYLKKKSRSPAKKRAKKMFSTGGGW